MSNAYLRLTLGALSVTLDRFLNGELPRIDADTSSSLLYTASGNAVVQGVQHEQFSLWNVEAYITRQQAEVLRLIWVESDLRRRSNQNPNILVADLTQPHVSKFNPTRAVAPGSAITVIGDYRSFFAQYNAVILQKPQMRVLGLGYAVEFTLQETEATAYAP